MATVFQGEHHRTRPLVWLYSGALESPDDPEESSVREWHVQSGDRDLICGMTCATFEDAQIGARLLAIRRVLDWTLESVSPDHMVVTCWCGWSHMIEGCYSDPIIEHVKSVHPDHPVVKG